jgi:hypothetical protein
MQTLDNKNRGQFIQELLLDVKWARGVLDKATPEDSPRARRAYVRVVLAALEGLMNLHRMVLTPAGRTEEEMADGDRKWRGMRFRERVRFVFRLLAELLDDQEVLPRYDRRMGRALADAIKLRNSVVHPETLEGITVTDADVLTLEMASDFVLGHLLVAFYKMVAFNNPDADLTQLMWAIEKVRADLRLRD